MDQRYMDLGDGKMNASLIISEQTLLKTFVTTGANLTNIDENC